MRTLQRHWSEMSIYFNYLQHKMGLGIAEIHRCYPQYPKTTLYYWHMKQLAEVDLGNSRHKNLGRPWKTTVCDCRQIIGTLQSLRRSVGTLSFVNRYSGGCQHECNNLNHLPDVSCMSSIAMGTNMKETGSPVVMILKTFLNVRISFLSRWSWLGPPNVPGSYE